MTLLPSSIIDNILNTTLPPRLIKRAVYITLYSVASRWASSSPRLVSVLLLLLCLFWLYWDAKWTEQATRGGCCAEWAVSFRVAEFAEGRDPKHRDVTVLQAATQMHLERHADCEAVRRFSTVQRRTHCAFAAKALVWGNDWEEVSAAEDALSVNVQRCMPRFYRFCMEVRKGAPLEAFVFEVRGEQYGADVQSFARTVDRVLRMISAADPAGFHCMSKSYIGRAGWHFQFDREPLFITTFAPCYSSSNPRYQFGAHPDSCFILFQPEESFYRHDLPPDKPRSATNWDHPADVRDRIRCNFKRMGREYRIPETVSYPTADFIVAAENVLDDEPIHFWTSNYPQTSDASRQ